MKKLVSLDVTEEEMDEARRHFEEEERWQKENPEKHKAIEIIGAAIIALEDLQKALRSS